MSPLGDRKGLGVALGEGVVVHAAANVAAAWKRLDVVNYFIRKEHGRHTEESPQGSATSGMGGSFAWGADLQSGRDSQVRQSGAGEAQVAATDSFHRQGQWLRARRPGSGQGAGEGWLGLVWGDLHGRGDRSSAERRAKADPVADEFRAGRRIPAGGARPHRGNSSVRTIGVTESRGGAPRRQEGRAISFED